MEPIDKSTPVAKNQDPEVDLGKFFSKAGGLASTLITGFQIFIKSLLNLGLGLLLYIKRSLIWLLIGSTIGLIYGFYIKQKQGDYYKSSLVVKTNFNSSRNLYEAVGYFNALINSSKTKELAALLNISETEAASIRYLESKPVKSELIIAELYQNTFLDKESGRRPRTDTFWTRNVNYEKFKNALTIYDYPIHEVSVHSSNSTIFPKIQEGIIHQVSGNELLQQRKSADVAMRKREIELLDASIMSLDTLKKVYNKRLSVTSLDQQNNSVTILSSNNPPISAPELELYDKLLELNEELKISTRKYLANDEIVQVHTPFSPIGQKDSIFKQNVTKYSLLGLIATFSILLLISLFKFLSSVEKQKNK